MPSPVNLPDPGIESVSLKSPALTGMFFTTSPPGKPPSNTHVLLIGQRNEESQTFNGQISLCAGLGVGESSRPPITLMSELISSPCGKGIWFLCIAP